MVNTGPGEVPSRKPTILVIDDNATNLDLVAEHLGEDDFEILVAEDGTIGIERARYVRPDLILLDVLMPGMDGLETCRRLKTEPATREIPVIFMTALTETEHKLKGFAAGAVDYVTKPVEREELLARVGVHLQIRELTESLREVNRTLERRVEERTRELARSNDDLRRSEEKYRRLVENLRREYFFYSHGTDGIFTYLSPSITNVLGYSPDEFKTHYAEFYTDNPVNEEALRHTESAIQGVQQPSYELEIFHKDGSIRNLEVTEFPIFDARGNVLCVEGIAHDVTERRRAEEMVRSSLAEAEAARDEIAAIVTSVPNGLIVTDLAGRITLVNRTAEILLGAAQEELLRRLAGEVIRDDNFHRYLSVSLSGAEPVDAVELELMDHGRGAMRSFQVGTSLVRTRKGVPTGAVILLRDVTREREIARLKDEFVSTAAHELNTPLTTVMGYLELLMGKAGMGGFSADEQREFLSVIYAKSEVLSRIVDDLLQLSRLDSGQALPLEKSRFEMQEVIRGVLDLFQDAARRFELDLPEDPLEISADRIRIAQVLEKIIDNAVRYSPGGSPVRIACARENEKVRVSVADQGIGMTPEQVEKIFEKFYRADASSTAVGGLGLGMSVAKDIVEAHGGMIWVESTPRQGTIATFVLPMQG